MPTKRLPDKASIAHLKYQTKDLLTALNAQDTQAAQRIREFHPRFSKLQDKAIFNSDLQLSDAQLAIAREYGFASWTRLKKHIEQPDHAVMPLPFQEAIDLIDAGDANGLRAHLQNHPGLARQRILHEGSNYFRNPALLDFIAENPIRNGTLPPNIVDVARVLLDAGEQDANETLSLVCSGRVPRECGVQIPLIELLCRSGADPNAAMLPAIVNGEFEAVHALLARGAAMTLPVAAAIGQTMLVLPEASAEDRHLALAFAAQFGNLDTVRLLLDAGEDPNRYNPVGAHSHSTPLHQAALAGHLDVVRLLVERGANLDFRDTIYQGTPIDWAHHAGKAWID